MCPTFALAEPEYSGEGAKQCLDCHGNPRVMGILDTAHAKREDPNTPAAQKACESCHGPSKRHTQFPMQVENLHFGKQSKAKAAVQNQACLECHGTQEQRADWKLSKHGFENLVCSTCHSIHDPAKVVPAKVDVSGGCSIDGCHADLMKGAAATEFSHAVEKSIGNQGQMVCTGCHSPHAPLNSRRCLDCHPQTPEILSKESEKAQRYHATAAEKGTECMRCHKALSHPIKPLQAASD